MTTEIQEVLVVGLSAVHTLHPISVGIDAFGHLYRPANDKIERCCQGLFSFFTTLYDKAWVSAIYYSNLNMIDDYKKGKITTEVFLENLLNIFSFLKGKENAKELLTNAWNAIVEVTDQDKEKLDYLKRQGKPIYFISNTNELNAKVIFDAFFGPNDSRDLSHNASKGEIIKLEANIHFVPSFRTGNFKNETPGLIGNLAAKLRGEGKSVHVISQFQADLDRAQELGLQNTNAREFFASLTAKPKMA